MSNPNIWSSLSSLTGHESQLERPPDVRVAQWLMPKYPETEV